MQKNLRPRTGLGGDAVERDIECAIRSDVNVLISGGDGRRRLSLAHLLHQRSRDMGDPFVLMESDRLPVVRAAWEFPLGGTMFIEEVADLSQRMQTELMLFLDRRSAQVHDGRADRLRRTRIVAATTYDMFQQIAERRFREDLFYRLNAIHVVLPEHDTAAELE